MLVNLDLTEDEGERFPLSALLHTIGVPLELDAVFKNFEEREAARNFMDLMQAERGRIAERTSTYDAVLGGRPAQW